jgi:hypothetical protein
MSATIERFDYIHNPMGRFCGSLPLRIRYYPRIKSRIAHSWALGIPAEQPNTLIQKRLQRQESYKEQLTTPKLLARFNTPDLMRRRAKTIANSNADHTKASDDALAELLSNFG